ncbi:MAG: hypothetical protein FI725_05570 [SAR202 cluster bacterium]|nr:hypothetical protein [SAR202 cluster bacterium]
MFIEFRSQIALTLTPSHQSGQLEVRLNGNTLFDRQAEGDTFPDLDNVNGWKQTIRNTLDLS